MRFLTYFVATLAASVVATTAVSDNWNNWSVSPAGEQPPNDLYRSEKDQEQKLIYLSGLAYDEQVVKSSGEFIGGKPWFITFVDPDMPEASRIATSLQHLAHYYQGDIQFAVTSTVLEESLCHTYDVYESPRSYYIDAEGMAYLFDPVLPAINTTTSWIDENTYKQNPHSFKASARWGDIKVNYWGALKKSIRLYYIENWRETFQPLY